MTPDQLAAELAARLIPADPDQQAVLRERLHHRPDVLGDAARDMDAAVAALVREAVIYLRACADAVTATRRERQQQAA